MGRVMMLGSFRHKTLNKSTTFTFSNNIFIKMYQFWSRSPADECQVLALPPAAARELCSDRLGLVISTVCCTQLRHLHLQQDLHTAPPETVMEINLPTLRG